MNGPQMMSTMDENNDYDHATTNTDYHATNKSKVNTTHCTNSNRELVLFNLS